MIFEPLKSLGVVNLYISKIKTNQPFTYTGYQFDPISDTLFAQARQYDSNIGRFISQDAHWGPGNMIFGDAIRQISNASLLPNPLAIRQSSNLYEYGLSNPKRYIDPLGKNVWLVHGTTGSNGGIGGGNPDFNYGIGHWDVGTIEFLGGSDGSNPRGTGFGQPIHLHPWYGNNYQDDRRTAAQALVDDILRVHGSNPVKPIRIIAYSHGGNVAMESIDMLYNDHGITVDTLINFGTPNRGDHRNSTPVGQLINVYNRRDSIQTLGGIDSFWQDGGNFRLLRGRRRHPNADENVRVRNRFWQWFGQGDYLVGIFSRSENHGIMHNSLDIWINFVLPLLDCATFQRDDTCDID